jgi:hypothetical protein
VIQHIVIDAQRFAQQHHEFLLQVLKRHRFTDYTVKARWRKMANQPRFHLIRNQYNALDMMRKRQIPQVRQAVTTLFSRIGKGIDQREKLT